MSKEEINIDQCSDEVLLQHAKTSDDDQYILALYLRYKYLIFGLCLKYLKNKHDAEDASMEIYQKLVDKHKKHNIQYFKSWFYTLSKNHCLEKLRSQKTAVPKLKEAAIMYSQSVFHPDSSTLDENQIKKLKTCIQKLNDLQKTCIQMFYFEKASYAEMSEEMNMEWNKIRSNIQNGRRNLKNCMES